MAKKKSMSQAQAVKAIDRYGILLTYPIDNRPAPESLWSVAYPGEKMLWEWDNGADDRVAQLWHLRTVLSTSREVVYAKWFRGRATFFSREVFTALLSLFGTVRLPRSSLKTEAQNILEILEMDSPQSTKQIKLATDLRGKIFESVYEKSMKQLWQKLWIVGFGEFEDGAFPSLAVGSSQALFEDLWQASLDLPPAEAQSFLEKKLGKDSLWLKAVVKIGPLSDAAASHFKV